MQFGFTLKPEHTIERTLALTRQAEAAGFDYGWLFDWHVLWRDPYPLLTLMAGATDRMRLGTCVTNPGTREPSVTASSLATLDELSAAAGWTSASGAATRPGGSSASRRSRWPHTEEAIRVIRALVAGEADRLRGHGAALPVDARLDAAGLGRRLRPDGPRDDRPRRRRDHPPARRPRPHPLVRRPGPRGGRRPPAATRPRSRSRRRRRPTSAPRDLGRERTRWFPALVSNHVVDLVNKYPREQLPESLTGYIHGPHRLRLPPPRRGRLVERGVRRRRGDRPVLRPRRGRRAHRQAPRARRRRRRPVQPLPHERRRGGSSSRPTGADVIPAFR